MSPNIYSHQSSNIRKTWFLMAIFLIIVIFLGWFFSFLYDSQVILYFAVIFALAMNFFSYWYSDKIALSISGAKEVKKDEQKELRNIVENLAITAGLPMPRIFLIEDPSPNAFATGRDKEHAVIAVTTGLLSILERSELEGVIAHEFSHIGNRDILLSTIVVVLAGFIALLSDIFLRSMLWGGGRDSKGNQFQVVLFIIGIVLAILAPIAATLIQLAVSRKREFLADASGALLTRYPEGLANALRKISEKSVPMKKANHATAHLFISNPFGNKKGNGFLNKIFLTHPPIEERIKALLGHSI